MSININLVNRISEGGKDRLKKIKALSFSILIIIAILSLILFLINYRFSASYVVREQNDLISELSGQNETASKIFLLNNRLSTISTLLEQRAKLNEKADKITADLPPTIKVQSFDIAVGGVSMELTSSSLLELNNFLNHMISLSKSKAISRVRLDSLTTDSIIYTMKINAN